MSSLSSVYSSYSNSLHFSREKYSEALADRSGNAADFYRQFLRELICRYQPEFADDFTRDGLHRELEHFFRTDKLDFVAIDGTCAKDAFQDFVVFSACAYGAKGQIWLGDDPPKIRYQRWTIERDVSMVAYMPVPYMEFADIVDSRYDEESFCVTENERVDMSRIETRMMELAEVFLAYNVATSSSIESPKIILLDRPLSGMFADLALAPSDVPMIGYPFDGRALTLADAVIALAHPFNQQLEIPGVKKFRQHTALIAQAHWNRTGQVDLSEFSRTHGLSSVEDATQRLLEGNAAIGTRTKSGGRDVLNLPVLPHESWDFSVRLFQSICKKLFLDKDQTALLYDHPDVDGIKRRRWMSPDDLRFLIGVGLRALVEECWARQIFLIGITKDSTSAYFSRNYLGVMKKLAEDGNGGYDQLNRIHVGPLPWTDRMLLEFLPHVDDALEAPWSTVEFDSTFMTVRVVEEQNGTRRIRGGYSDAVAQERLFAKSLAQFFLARSRPEPLGGHVIFIDRLIHPSLDSNLLSPLVISSPAIGSIRPFSHVTNSVPNRAQNMMMYLLDVLTRNLYPEMIGYPDPLHKADWGAKTVGRKMKEIIMSSTYAFRANPLAKTARSVRGERDRR